MAETWMIDHLLSTINRRDLFLDDIANCPKIILRLDKADTSYVEAYFFLTKFVPVCVRWYQVALGVPSDALSAWYYSVDWTNVGTTELVYDATVDYWGAIDLWVRTYYSTNYRVARINPAQSASWSYYIDITTNYYAVSPTPNEFYKRWSHMLNYQDSDSQKALKRRLSASLVTPADGAWSAQNWPEVAGMATRYIDNVGIFIPDYLDIDFNLSHSLGSELVGCRFIRAPSSATESQHFQLDFIEAITGMSGGAQGPGKVAAAIYGAGTNIVGMFTSNVRVIFPRIRAFGRQEGLPDYESYKAAMTPYLGTGFQTFDWQGKKYEWVSKDQKTIVRLTKSQYDSFLDAFSYMASPEAGSSLRSPFTRPTGRRETVDDWVAQQPDVNNGGGGL